MTKKTSKTPASTAAPDPTVAQDPTTLAILERWIEFAPNDRLALLVRDTSRGLTRGLQLRLSEYGIPFGYWSYLRILWEQDGLSQSDLSIKAGLTDPTTHTASQRMEALGLIKRKYLAGDRKKRHIFLTDKGRRLMGKLIPMAVEVNGLALDGISEKDLETVRRSLVRMLQNLARDEVDAAAQGMAISATRELAQTQARMLKNL